jgi:hypothetical protein
MASPSELKAAINAAEPVIRTKFEAMLPLSGWPSDVKDKLTLDVTPESIVLVWPPDMEKKVGDLEYGTIGKPPTHFIAKVEEMIQVEIQSALLNITLEILFTRGLPV